MTEQTPASKEAMTEALKALKNSTEQSVVLYKHVGDALAAQGKAIMLGTSGAGSGRAFYAEPEKSPDPVGEADTANIATPDDPAAATAEDAGLDKKGGGTPTKRANPDIKQAPKA